MHLVVGVHVLGNVVNVVNREPVRYVYHAWRQSAHKFEIDDCNDVPLIVDEDVALVHIGQCKHERIVTRALTVKFREQGS